MTRIDIENLSEELLESVENELENRYPDYGIKLNIYKNVFVFLSFQVRGFVGPNRIVLTINYEQVRDKTIRDIQKLIVTRIIDKIDHTLKPCPDCGTIPLLYSKMNNPGRQYICPGCGRGKKSNVYFAGEEDARMYWNSGITTLDEDEQEMVSHLKDVLTRSL